MDSESLIPLGIIVAIAVGVLSVAMWSRIVGNTTSRSGRARELNALATKLGLNYVADTNTLSERLWKHDRKFNLIEGEYDGKEIEVYDYQTTTKYKFAPYGQDALQGTYLNGTQYKNLSVGEIEGLILGKDVEDSKNIKHKTGSRFGPMTYAFLIILVFLIFVKLYSLGIL